MKQSYKQSFNKNIKTSHFLKFRKQLDKFSQRITENLVLRTIPSLNPESIKKHKSSEDPSPKKKKDQIVLEEVPENVVQSPQADRITVITNGSTSTKRKLQLKKLHTADFSIIEKKSDFTMFEDIIDSPLFYNCENMEIKQEIAQIGSNNQQLKEKIQKLKDEMKEREDQIATFKKKVKELSKNQEGKQLLNYAEKIYNFDQQIKAKKKRHEEEIYRLKKQYDSLHYENQEVQDEMKEVQKELLRQQKKYQIKDSPGLNQLQKIYSTLEKQILDLKKKLKQNQKVVKRTEEISAIIECTYSKIKILFQKVQIGKEIDRQSKKILQKIKDQDDLQQTLERKKQLLKKKQIQLTLKMKKIEKEKWKNQKLNIEIGQLNNSLIQMQNKRKNTHQMEFSLQG